MEDIFHLLIPFTIRTEMQRIPSDNPCLKYTPIKGIKQKGPGFPSFPSKEMNTTVLASLLQKLRINNHVACVTHARPSFPLVTTDYS